MTIRWRSSGILLFFLLGLAACEQHLTSRSGGGECFESADVTVWEDTNGDGVHDADEPPVEGIEIVAFWTGVGTPGILQTATTSVDGVAKLGFIMGGQNDCSGKGIQVGVMTVTGGYRMPSNPAIEMSEVKANNGRVEFGLVPDHIETEAPATSSLLPVTVTPTTEATFAPATASETFAPTQEETNPCEVIMTRTQAEAILGPMPGDPFQLELVGGGSGMLCVFDGALNTASVELHKFTSAADARANFETGAGETGEPVSGIGDKASWNESGLQLSVLRGTITLYIVINVPDHAQEQAIQVAQIAVVRIP